MEAGATPVRWTWTEFARLPEEPGHRQEIIADELFVTPSPSPRHQRVVASLIVVLGRELSGRGLGEILPGPLDVLLAEGDYLVPDLVFVSAGREGLVSDRGIEGAPDLVVEILSPSTASRDRGIKRDRYRLHGVPEYWIVDPDARTVEAWSFGAGHSRHRVYHAGDDVEWSPAGADGPVIRLGVAALFPAAHPPEQLDDS